MKDKVKTLLVYADRTGWRATLKDTLLQGIFGVGKDYALPSPLRRSAVLRKLFMTDNWYAGLSYVNDWKDAFEESPLLDVEACGISNLMECRRSKRKIIEYPLVAVLHSATGDDVSVLSRMIPWFARRRGKLLVFVGNEYNLMSGKIRFIAETKADYIGTQLPLETARWLYEECHSATILPAPHALNPKVYHPRPEAERRTDIGFRGLLYPFYIGDNERTAIINYFRENGKSRGLICDIRAEKAAREEWSRLLSAFRGVIGAEAGTYYPDRTSKTINEVSSYVKSHPGASFEEVHEKFFLGRERAHSGKCVSSRHFEPIGTKTCQILVEGGYNGILAAGENYIPVKKDLSDIGEAIEKFKDETYRKTIVERTFEYAMDEHTYGKRVSAILKAALS